MDQSNDMSDEIVTTNNRPATYDMFAYDVSALNDQLLSLLTVDLCGVNMLLPAKPALDSLYL